MHDSLQRMLSRGAGALKVRRLAVGWAWEGCSHTRRLPCSGLSHTHCVAWLAGPDVDAPSPCPHPLLSAPQALTSGVKTALLAPLVLGVDSAPAQAHAALALRKCGACDLVGEVRALALQLSRLAQVTEAVAAPWYQALSADLL